MQGLRSPTIDLALLHFENLAQPKCILSFSAGCSQQKENFAEELETGFFSS